MKGHVPPTVIKLPIGVPDNKIRLKNNIRLHLPPDQLSLLQNKSACVLCVLYLSYTMYLHYVIYTHVLSQTATNRVFSVEIGKLHEALTNERAANDVVNSHYVHDLKQSLQRFIAMFNMEAEPSEDYDETNRDIDSSYEELDSLDETNIATVRLKLDSLEDIVPVKMNRVKDDDEATVRLKLDKHVIKDTDDVLPVKLIRVKDGNDVATVNLNNGDVSTVELKNDVSTVQLNGDIAIVNLKPESEVTEDNNNKVPVQLNNKVNNRDVSTVELNRNVSTVKLKSDTQTVEDDRNQLENHVKNAQPMLHLNTENSHVITLTLSNVDSKPTNNNTRETIVQLTNEMRGSNMRSTNELRGSSVQSTINEIRENNVQSTNEIRENNVQLTNQKRENNVQFGNQMRERIVKSTNKSNTIQSTEDNDLSNHAMLSEEEVLLVLPHDRKLRRARDVQSPPAHGQAKGKRRKHRKAVRGNKGRRGCKRFVSILLKGAAPTASIRDGGVIKPWYPDVRATGNSNVSSHFILQELNGKIQIMKSGLYMVYAQIYYTSSDHQDHTNYSDTINSYSMNVASAGNERAIAVCSVHSSLNHSSEVSCHLSIVYHLGAGDRVYLVQREPNRQILLKDGYSYFGLTTLTVDS
ncbi:putative uncharacterized protein DDB_G0286333 isoform X2 [Diaphorina citri]|uniref:THD domain-containing protein n=1 Tax=Diaphorina citri TaxID=121845 RepID=A0A1S4EEM8_DIACI|nr:putative uncharacterized protein DDB_G0286333 isoform X2 [Diaphorina citri]